MKVLISDYYSTSPSYESKRKGNFVSNDLLQQLLSLTVL